MSLDSSTISRVNRIAKLFPLLFAVIWIRLFYWQVIRGPELQARAAKQHQISITLQANRGQIYDRNGSLLAGTESVYHLFAYKPQLTISLSELADKLAPLLTEEASSTTQVRQYLLDRLNLSSNWVSLKHNLKTAVKDKIKEFDIPGLGFEDSHLRYYPESSLSAHLLGFVGKNQAGEGQGYFGLEGFFDRSLKGRSGKVRAEKDALGNQILVGGYEHYQALTGNDLHTSLDKTLQYLAETHLLAGIERYQAQSGSVIILESNTAQIIAMASFPNYAPADFSEYPAEYHKNPAVANLFEPGSIFKPLVMAAAFNEGVIDNTTICDICAAPVQIGKYSIKTWDEQYHPNTGMADIIANSDNTGMVFIARRLGATKMSHYFNQLGLGQKTGVELQEEVTSKLKDASQISEIDLATQSFGQGIALTPLQMVSAFNTLANHGQYLNPRIILGSQYQAVSVFSPETVKDITDIMIQAVEKHAVSWQKPPNLLVAGKTGTAQIAVAGEYDADKTVASFVGFFPADKPKYTMLVTLTSPQTSKWGSETAAPLWFSLMKQIMM